MTLEKEWVAEMFALQVGNISSYSVEKTFNLRWGMDILDKYELWQEIIIKVNTKKPVFEIGKGAKTCKLEGRVWDRVQQVRFNDKGEIICQSS